VKTPLSLDDARRLVAEYIEYYNTIRLHSAIGYIAPADKLNGREKEIFEERDRKLEAARQQRMSKRQQHYQIPPQLGADSLNTTETIPT